MGLWKHRGAREELRTPTGHYNSPISSYSGSEGYERVLLSTVLVTTHCVHFIYLSCYIPIECMQIKLRAVVYCRNNQLTKNNVHDYMGNIRENQIEVRRVADTYARNILLCGQARYRMTCNSSLVSLCFHKHHPYLVSLSFYALFF